MCLPTGIPQNDVRDLISVWHFSVWVLPNMVLAVGVVGMGRCKDRCGADVSEVLWHACTLQPGWCLGKVKVRTQRHSSRNEVRLASHTTQLFHAT